MAKLQYNKWKKVYRVLNEDGTSKTFKSESQARNYLGKLDAKKPTWEQKGFKDQFAMLSEEDQDKYMDKLSAEDFMEMNMFEAKVKRAEGKAKYKEFQAKDAEYEKKIKQEAKDTARDKSAKEQLRLLKESRAKSDDYYKNPPPLAPEQEAQLEEQSGKLKERLEAFTDPSKIKEPQLRGPSKPEYGIKKIKSKWNIPSRKKIITPKTSQEPQKVIIDGKRLTADEAMKKLKLLKQKRGY